MSLLVQFKLIQQQINMEVGLASIASKFLNYKSIICCRSSNIINVGKRQFKNAGTTNCIYSLKKKLY